MIETDEKKRQRMEERNICMGHNLGRFLLLFCIALRCIYFLQDDTLLAFVRIMIMLAWTGD